MTKDTRSELLTIVQAMSAEEMQNFVDQILVMMSEKSDITADICKNEIDELVRDVHGALLACPHCESTSVENAIIKKGHNRNGAQRFYCKYCGKFFVAATGTAFAHTRKHLSVWRKFIELTITGASVSVCEEECHISHQTAFTWRHKVLNVFKVAQENITMTGWVEADEMLVPLSYKGNHVRGKVGERRVKVEGIDTKMPRKALKRGSDNKAISSKTKACIFCMVENADQTFYGAVPGIGFMNADTLDATLGQCVDRLSAVMLVDQYKITRTYLDSNKYKNIVLASNTSENPNEHKPEIQGENRDIHLQHVNAMHTHLRKFLRDYYGVSSKYLANYVALYVWLKNNDGLRQRQKSIAVAEQRAIYADCYVSRRQIESLPMVPCVVRNVA